MEVINAINENDEFSIWEDVYVDFCKSIFKEHLPDTKIIEVYATEAYDRLFLHVDGTDYIIRMWNLTSRNIDWTLYKEVPDSDGGSHGEEICEGFYKIPSSIDAASALDNSKWERFKEVPLFEKTGCNKIVLVNNASDLCFDDEFLSPDTIYFDGINNCCTDGDFDDFTSSDIVLFKKDSLVVTLEWCLEHPEFNDFMSEDEIQEWAEKKPWKKTKGTVDEIISRMVLAQNFGDDELFSMDFKIHGEASTEKVEELFISLGRAQMCLKYIYISVDLKETDCNKIAFNSDKYFVQHFVKEAYGYSIVLPTSLAELQEGIFSKAFSVKCDSPEFVIKGNSIMNKDQTKVITSWEPENKNSNAEDSENERSKSYDYDWKLLEDKALFELDWGYVHKARWVDDVYDFKGEELGEEDVLFFDGTNSYFYMPDEDFPEIYDFDPEPIICFLKNHKRTTLDYCIENNTVDQIMTKSELQDWINEDPWKQKDVDIDELMSLLILNHISWLYGNHSEEEYEPKWNFSVHGEVTTEKLDTLFEMIHCYHDFEPNPCWYMKLDLTDVQGLEEINWDLDGLRIALPSTVKKIKGGALRETFRFSCDSPELTVVNGLLLNKQKSKIISTIHWGTISRIPSFVTEIDKGAFRYSKNNSSYIPGNIKKLNKESFEFSKWKDNKLVIPESIEEIPERCFFECEIEEVILPKNLKSIGKEAFSNWGGKGSSLKKIIVPENCKIEDDSFAEETEIIRLKPEDFPEIKYPKVIEFDRNKLTNIAIFDENLEWLKLVDDVWAELGYDSYFDGFEVDSCGDISERSLDKIYAITKNHKRISLAEYFTNNDLVLMTKEEIESWLTEKPWKKTKGTVDEIIPRMVLYHNFGDDEYSPTNFKIHGEASTEKVEELFISLGSALMGWKYISVNLKDITGCNKIAFNSDKFFDQHFVKEAYGYSIVLPTSLAELQEGIFSKAFSVKCDSPEFVIKGNSIMNKDQTKVITSWEPENKNSSAEDSEDESFKSYDYDWKLLKDKALFNLRMGYVYKAKWVDDVYDFMGVELGEEDILFFDGTNSYFYLFDDECYYPVEVGDFNPESIICFLKNHKRTTLDCCIENNTVEQIMTKDELQDWIDENPWEQNDVDIDELITLLILSHISRLNENHSEFDDENSSQNIWNFSVHGEVTTEKLDTLFEMIHWYRDFEPDPCWSMKLDLTDVQGLEEINWDLEGLRIALPSTVKKIKGGALRETFSFLCDSPEFTVVNGLLLNKEKSKVISTINCGTISRIPSYVTEIDEEAFQSSKNNSSYIPGNIKKLNKKSFEFSEWKDNKLVIPESIEEIPESCFTWCNLEEVILPKNLKSIGKEAFSSRVAKGSSLKKIIVPENCKIAEDAFDEETEIIRLRPEDFPEIKYPKVIDFDRNKLANIAIFDEDSTYLELVDDVNSNEFFEMDFWDKTYFDGFAENYGDGAYETSLDKIHAITKSHKRISLAEYFTNNDLVLMTKEEIESWLTEKPWKKPLDIDQALVLIFILKSDEFRYFTFNDKGVIEFKLSGKIAVKKMKNFLSLIKDLADLYDDYDFDEGDDFIEKIRLVLPKGCKVPEIEFYESVEIIYSDDME